MLKMPISPRLIAHYRDEWNNAVTNEERLLLAAAYGSLPTFRQYMSALNDTNLYNVFDLVMASGNLQILQLLLNAYRDKLTTYLDILNTPNRWMYRPALVDYLLSQVQSKRLQEFKTTFANFYQVISTDQFFANTKYKYRDLRPIIQADAVVIYQAARAYMLHDAAERLVIDYAYALWFDSTRIIKVLRPRLMPYATADKWFQHLRFTDIFLHDNALIEATEQLVPASFAPAILYALFNETDPVLHRRLVKYYIRHVHLFDYKEIVSKLTLLVRQSISVNWLAFNFIHQVLLNERFLLDPAMMRFVAVLRIAVGPYDITNVYGALLEHILTWYDLRRLPESSFTALPVSEQLTTWVSMHATEGGYAVTASIDNVVVVLNSRSTYTANGTKTNRITIVQPGETVVVKGLDLVVSRLE